MTVMIRSREDLSSQRAIAVDELAALESGASVETRGYYGGAIEALDWLLGTTALSPVTSTYGYEPSRSAVADEHRAVEDVLYNRRDGGGRPRSWYGSMDVVLSWALNNGNGRPFQGSESQVRPEAALRREAEILELQRSAGGVSPAVRQSMDGARAALDWLVGDGDGPMSGLPRRRGGPSADQVDDEADLSRKRRFVDKADQGPDWNFVFGVDKALDWALGDDNTSAL